MHFPIKAAKRVKTPAIQIRGLVVRFGGLTAIAPLDLLVEHGKITSIIGPNGAGKTTLFNCVSGVLRATSGTILVAGRDVRRAWRRKTTAACLSVGLLTAALCGCLAMNVNGLWRAAIRRPNNLASEPFNGRAVVDGLLHYWRGALAVERGSVGRWNVVTADGGILLATVETQRQARQLRDDYERLRRAPPSALTAARTGKQWLLVGGGDGTAVAPGDRGTSFATRQAAVDRRELLIAIADAARSRRQWTWAATLAGALLGSFGMFSVWQRTRWTPEVIAAAGVSRTFQNLRLFPRLTVFENVLVACETAAHAWPPAEPVVVTRTGQKQQGPEKPSSAAQAHQLLEFVGLGAVAERPCGQLAYGDRRRVEIARALARRPWLLLLDEPAAGMNTTEKKDLMDLIRSLRGSGITVLLIEHEMHLVMGISDHVVVLANGRKIAEGRPEAIQRDQAVIEAYLGTADLL